MGVALLLSVPAPPCVAAAVQRALRRNAEKTHLYLEIHHGDVNPNIMAGRRCW